MESEQEVKSCPFCGETILAVAKKCCYCNEMLAPRTLEPSSPVQQTNFVPPYELSRAYYRKYSPKAFKNDSIWPSHG